MYSTRYCLINVLGISILSYGCQSHHFNNSKDHLTGSIDTASYYNQIKDLEGEWQLVGGSRLGEPVEAVPNETFVSYLVSSGGHAVIERLFVNQPNEMVSVYYIDKGILMMDHYCSLGNQPRMVAIPSNFNEIEFALLGVTNLQDPNALHISSHALVMSSTGGLTAVWGATKDQEQSTGSRYQLERISQD